MTKQDAVRLLEETLEMKPNSLTGPEHLRDLELWDSLSTMSFIAMVDKKFGVRLPGSSVVRCKTVNDLLDLMKPKTNSKAA